MLPGKHGSQESHAAFQRLVLEIASSVVIVEPGQDVSVAELILAYLQFAAGYYRDADGKPGREHVDMKAALQPVLDLYADTDASKFGPLALKAVREKMVGNGLSRRVINARINRIKRAWKWATAEELIPPSAYEALRTLPGLRAGKTTAKERPKVKPVDWEHVEATLPYLSPQVRTMVLLLWHTGARPGELVQMRLADIDRSGDPWVYTPRSHKTAHHGHSRRILLGVNAVKVLTEFLAGRTLDPAKPVFSPRDAREDRYARMRSGRKSKVQPSQVNRRKRKPSRAPGEQYTVESIGYAIRRACKAHSLTPWHPYQIRHAYGTRVRRDFGLEAAQVLLGHAKADVTEVYAERDLQRGIDVVRQIG